MSIPSVGLGTWKIPKDVVGNVVYDCIKAGFRHFDCACDYGNEVEVGAGLLRAINDGLVTREELWITSKLWNTFHSPEHVELAARKSLADLGLDYFDLYVIHFPISLKYVPIDVRYPPEWIHDPSAEKPTMIANPVPYSATWKAMEAVHALGLAKHIGVCNLTCFAIMDLLSYAVVKPHSNQVELHPYLSQQTLVDYCQSQGVAVVAYSPLGSASYIELGGDAGYGKGVLEEATIVAIANAHSKSPAQIVLRWNIQRGVVVIPKSLKLERNVENFNIFDFELSVDEMLQISSLNRNARFNDPGVYGKFMGLSLPIFN